MSGPATGPAERGHCPGTGERGHGQTMRIIHAGDCCQQWDAASYDGKATIARSRGISNTQFYLGPRPDAEAGS